MYILVDYTYASNLDNNAHKVNCVSVLEFYNKENILL